MNRALNILNAMVRPEWVRRWGHYWITWPALVLTAAIMPAGMWWLTLLALVAAFFWIFIASLSHDVQICPQCATTFPLQPSEEAERRHRWLWMAHHGLIVLLTPFALYLVWWTAAMLDAIPSSISPVMVIFMTGFLVNVRTRRIHNQLQPWCKWCRRRRGDDDNVTVPDPTPSESRPR